MCIQFIKQLNNRSKNIYYGPYNLIFRRCTSCLQIKLEHNSFFLQRQHKFNAKCKDCVAKYRKIIDQKKIINNSLYLQNKYSVGLLFCYNTLKKKCFVGPYNTYYRKCSRCNEIKIEQDHFYYINKNRGKEYDIYCKLCAKIKSKIARIKNPEYMKIYNQKPEVKFKKKLIEEKNKQNILWLEKRKLTFKKSLDKNKEKRRLKRQTEEFKHKRRISKRQRKLNNPLLKLRENISNAILRALKKGKSNKAGYSILQFLGYTIFDLKQHLTNQFDQYMSWNNYGSYWHIDHIIPQSDLPYANMKDHNFKLCWALNNLRPLEAKQNIIDGVRRIRHKKAKEDSNNIIF